jgi:O-antigen ligase
MTRQLLDARVLTLVVAGFVAWLPLQTPVAIALYQYGGLSADAVRMVVLAKDLIVAIGLPILLVRYFSTIRIYWFDLAAAALALLFLLYAVVPLVTDQAGLGETVAALRQFLLPLTIYVLGRCVAAAGVRLSTVMQAALVVAIAAAAFTVAVYLLLPITFWVSTLDLVSYVRDVQGLAYANSLFDISVVGTYGLDSGAVIGRATGPFTHPVGTAAYFLLPFAIAVAALLRTRPLASRQAAVRALLATLFLAPILMSLSRGSWLGVAVILVVSGLFLRRVRVATAILVCIAIFVVVVPPFSISVRSALEGTDGSAIMHQQAIEDGFRTVREHPLGAGVSESDYQFGSEGGGTLLENTYLAIYVGAGPVGLIAFLAWIGGMIRRLLPRRPRARSHWPSLALVATLGGLAVASLTAATAFRFTTGATFWLVLGVLVGQLPNPGIDVSATVRRWRRVWPARQSERAGAVPAGHASTPPPTAKAQPELPRSRIARLRSGAAAPGRVKSAAAQSSKPTSRHQI